jgi:hypothetical protein
MAELEYPRFDPKKGWPRFWVEVSEWEEQKREPKKRNILKFINEWISLKKKDEFKSFCAFKNIYLEQLPNDDKSKIFLIKNFEKYNEEFKLDLEYDEKLFTRYNVLYMLKLMLKTINYDLKKIVKNYSNNNKSLKKIKSYTIIDLNKL